MSQTDLSSAWCQDLQQNTFFDFVVRQCSLLKLAGNQGERIHFLRTWKLDFVNFIHVQQRAVYHLAKKTAASFTWDILKENLRTGRQFSFPMVPRYGSLSGRNRKMRLAIGACSKYPPDRIQARCFCCFSWVIWGKGWVEKQIGNDFVLSY